MNLIDALTIVQTGWRTDEERATYQWARQAVEEAGRAAYESNKPKPPLEWVLDMRTGIASLTDRKPEFPWEITVREVKE